MMRNEMIMGRSWAKIQMMQGSIMQTWHNKNDHRARINGHDLVGVFDTEIGLCEALDKIEVHPRRLKLLKQDDFGGHGSTLVNYWVSK